jgi:hypothetical protein
MFDFPELRSFQKKSVEPIISEETEQPKFDPTFLQEKNSNPTQALTWVKSSTLLPFTGS